MVLFFYNMFTNCKCKYFVLHAWDKHVSYLQVFCFLEIAMLYGFIICCGKKRVTFVYVRQILILLFLMWWVIVKDVVFMAKLLACKTDMLFLRQFVISRFLIENLDFHSAENVGKSVPKKDTFPTVLDWKVDFSIFFLPRSHKSTSSQSHVWLYLIQCPYVGRCVKWANTYI